MHEAAQRARSFGMQWSASAADSHMTAPVDTGQGAELRDYLAAERTLLAWIRTGAGSDGLWFCCRSLRALSSGTSVCARRFAAAWPRVVLMVWSRFCRRQRNGEPADGVAPYPSRQGNESEPRRPAALNDTRIVHCFVPGTGRTRNGHISAFCRRFGISAI